MVRAPGVVAAPSIRLLCALLLPFALGAGCVHPRYDAKLDAAASELQGQLTAFVEKMNVANGLPEGRYEANRTFYEGVQQRLRELRKQAEATGSRELPEHVDLIAANVESLRKLHEGRGEKGLEEALSGPALTALDVQFKALAKLQGTYRGAERPAAP